MFRRIVFSAVLAGVVAGVLLTGIQQLQVAPIIAAAETYEAAGSPGEAVGSVGEAAGAAEEAHAPADGGSHAHGTREHDGHEHDGHEHDGWSPADGFERTFWTGVANVGMAVGFALLLVAAFSLRENVSWRQGILWGLGGYAAFFALPALGLAPELPGTEAAALESRQAWWLVTVTLSAIGVALIGLTRGWRWKAAAVVLIAVPHLIGAPHPEIGHGLAPAELVRMFIVATAIANAVFWVVLGAGCAIAFRKLA